MFSRSTGDTAMHAVHRRAALLLFASLACAPSANEHITASAGKTSSTTSTNGTDETSGTTSTSGATSTSAGDPSQGTSTACDTACDTACEGDECCPYAECDVLAQDCPRGEKCSPDARTGNWESAHCVPVLSDGTPGELCHVEEHLCSTLDDCALGTVCWNIDAETDQGVCISICSPELGCDPGLGCLAKFEGLPPLCEPSCDPLLQDCPEDAVCRHLEDVEFICTPDGRQNIGDACGPLLCAAGLHCADAVQLPSCDHDRCCTPFCDLSEPDSCATVESAECAPFATGNRPGIYLQGYCGLPE